MIGSLLFLSGIISSLELVRFNKATSELLSRSQGSIELSKNMLDAIQEQNTALLMGISDTTNFYDSVRKASREDFNRYFLQAQSSLKKPHALENIAIANAHYNKIVAQVADTVVTIEWFSQVYKTSYYNLTHAIKEFMLSVQHDIIDFTSELESNAYRASMVGIIALGAGILLMVIFFYMINSFFIGPVLKIKQALKGYLSSNIPFEVNITSKDEILTLKESISQLIDKLKKRDN